MSEANLHIKIWEKCLSLVRDVVGDEPCRVWFGPIVPKSLANDTLRIEVPSMWFREYFEENYAEYLLAALRKEIGRSAKLEYLVKIDQKSKSIPYPQQGGIRPTNRPIQFSSAANSDISNPFVIPGIAHLNIDPELDPSLNFNNFIEGECNKLARAAGETIANDPGKNAFNPLFIHGGSGLGKTHLAQAIGIAIKEKFKEKIVLYLNATTFQNQYVRAAVVKNQLTDFLNFYCQIDVLIIDDIQEIAGKEGTQGAYFHIFNNLHQHAKQLIITSDKSPADLKDINDRLLSRFKWGLITEIRKPDYNTRVAIIKHKSFNDGFELPDDVVAYLADNSSTNIREMEGALTSLIFQATITNRPIDLALAQATLNKISLNKEQNLTIDQIRNIVCNYFGLTPDMLASKSRKREICQARQIAMYLSRNLTKSSLSSIGEVIGGKDHATVLHSYNTVCSLMDTDAIFRQYVKDIEKQLKA